MQKPTNIAGTNNPVTKLQLMWARGPLWDHLLALGVVGLWLAITWWAENPPLLTEVAVEARRPLFQTTATVAGAMAGLTFTSISIMINLVKTPMSAIDRLTKPEEKRQVGDVFLAVLPRLLMTFIFAAVTLAVESDSEIGTWWIQALVLWFALASVSGLARVVWVLKRLLKMAQEK